MDSLAPFQEATPEAKYIEELNFSKPENRKLLLVQRRNNGQRFYPQNGANVSFSSGPTGNTVINLEIDHEQAMDLSSMMLHFVYSYSSNKLETSKNQVQPILSTDWAGLFSKVSVKVGGVEFVQATDSLPGLVYALQKKWAWSRQYSSTQLDAMAGCGTEESLKDIQEKGKQDGYEVSFPLIWLPVIGSIRQYFPTKLMGKIHIQFYLNDAYTAHRAVGPEKNSMKASLPEKLEFTLSHLYATCDTVELPGSYYTLLESLLRSGSGVELPVVNYHLHPFTLPANQESVTANFTSAHREIDALYFIFRNLQPSSTGKYSYYANWRPISFKKDGSTRFYVMVNGRKVPSQWALTSLSQVAVEGMTSWNDLNNNLSTTAIDREALTTALSNVSLHPIEDQGSFCLGVSLRKYVNGVSDLIDIMDNGENTMESGNPTITFQLENIGAYDESNDIPQNQQLMMIVKSVERIMYKEGQMTRIQ